VPRPHLAQEAALAGVSSALGLCAQHAERLAGQAPPQAAAAAGQSTAALLAAQISGDERSRQLLLQALMVRCRP
jgi:hypothetical protein